MMLQPAKGCVMNSLIQYVDWLVTNGPVVQTILFSIIEGIDACTVKRVLRTIASMGERPCVVLREQTNAMHTSVSIGSAPCLLLLTFIDAFQYRLIMHISVVSTQTFALTSKRLASKSRKYGPNKIDFQFGPMSVITCIL